MIDVRTLVDSCFPAGARLVGAEALMEREVTWATRPRPSPPAFGHLSGGEMVLLRAEDLATVDDRLTLTAAIRQLAGFGVSAVAVAGSICPADEAIAAKRNVALIELSADADLNQIERRASHLIAERRRDRQRRGHEAGRKLMELAIAGESLAAVISTLNQLAGQAVALEGRDGRLLSYFARVSQPGREDVAPLLESNYGAARNWLAVASDASAAEPPTMRMALGISLDRTIAPVIGRDGLLGCLSLIAPVGTWAEDDALLASRGAAACAIVLAREFAGIAARREIELNVLDEVLDGALRNEATLLLQARRLGHNLEGPHRMVTTDFGSHDPVELRGSIAEALDLGGQQLLWRIKERTLEIVLPETTAPTDVMESIERHLGINGLVAGVGSPHSGLDGLQQSRNEARQAMTIQGRLGISGSVAHFANLGIFRFLFATESLPEFDAFHDETLGSLVIYDDDHGSDLLSTLRAFFEANGSPKEAAQQLGVHRNTVLYRLDRIGNLTGYDLTDSETRLRLHLALSMNTIKGSRQRGSTSRRSTVRGRQAVRV